MEENRIAAGDFDIKPKTDRSDYPKYYVHGLALSLAMGFILPFVAMFPDLISTGFEYLTFYLYYPSPSVPSPIVSGIFLIDIPTVGLLFILGAFGSFNLYLTERIWKKPQKKSWERRLGIGTFLFVILLTYHILHLVFIAFGEIGLVLNAVCGLVIFPIFDGVFGYHITSIQLESI